jgi:adenine deaminase
MQADLLFLQAKVYNSYFKQWSTNNVAVKDGKFFYIGLRGEDTFQAKQVINAEGLYMVPGFIDIHLHIESTMVTPESFSAGLLRNGVTTIVPEPHEMANVFGLDGVLEMIKASRNCPVDMFYAIPSSVPSTSMETTGGSIEIEDMDALLSTGDVICLGEIMNYVDIITDPDCKTNRILEHIRSHYPELVIEGHVPKLLDLDLQRVIYAGVNSDHTHQTLQGLEERIAAGMFIEIQEKSMTPEVMDYLIRHDVSEHFCFVTDDVMADSFRARGHLNQIVRKAIGMGMSPERAIYAATFSPSRRMRMYDRGSIAPGKIADFQLISDLSELKLESVYKNGAEVYSAAKAFEPQSSGYRFPEHFYHSVQLDELSAADFEAAAGVEDGIYRCRVMTIQDGSTFTKESQADVPAANGRLLWEQSGCGMIATFERYGKGRQKAFGFIAGDTIQRGAVATTYSHDNHNLLVIGHNVEDMVLAANTVIRQQGGFCVTLDGEIKANMHLPVGGILTEDPLDLAAESVQQVREAMEELGYKHYNPIMSIATHSLPVSPYLKITDHGLIDVNAGKVVPLIIEQV